MAERTDRSKISPTKLRTLHAFFARRSDEHFCIFRVRPIARLKNSHTADAPANHFDSDKKLQVLYLTPKTATTSEKSSNRNGPSCEFAIRAVQS